MKFGELGEVPIITPNRMPVGISAVYVLLDDDDSIFYVGCTKDPCARLAGHRRDARKRRCRMVLIELAESRTAGLVEEEWIRFYQSKTELMNDLPVGVPVARESPFVNMDAELLADRSNRGVLAIHGKLGCSERLDRRLRIYG